MKLIFAFLISLTAFGQVRMSWIQPVPVTVATLPTAASSTSMIFVINDAATAGSCTAGSGSAWSLCVSNGTIWVPLGDGGGSAAAGTMTQAVANSAANTVSVSVGTSGTAFAKTPFTVDPSTGAFGGTFTIPATSIPQVPLVSGTTITTLAAPSGFAVCTSTCTVTIPAPAVGNQFCVRNAPGSATVITLAALGSGKYYELTDGSAYATANHKLVSGGAATDKICVVGLDATHYLTYSSTGTWTDTP